MGADKSTADIKYQGQEDATAFLRRFARKPEAAGLLVPDSRQRLFGSLAEAVPGSCPDGKEGHTTFCTNAAATSRAAFSKASENLAPSHVPSSRCCPTTFMFDRLHETYFARFAVEGCIIRRGDEMPISWHGDGLGKWMHLLALTDLAGDCHRVARLVLANHPVDMLDHLFARFSATQKPGSAQPSAPAYAQKQ